MLPVRLAIILLALFSLTFWAAPSSLAQRRVFTNDDFPQPAPPPAPAAAEPEAVAAEEAPAETAADDQSGFEEPEPDPNLPPGLTLSNFLQGALRRFHTEFANMLPEETDPVRQERLRTMMNLTMQLLTHNQLFIADLRAQHEAAMAAEAEAQAQAGAPPAP